MANDAKRKVMILDTVGTVLASGQVIQVLKIRWVGASAGGHAVSLTDINDNVMWETVAGGANYVEIDTFTTDRESDDQCFRWNGLKLATLGSGKLYIYIR